MSKAKLKKHLLSLTKEQITDIVLELYDARKEAKEYLEFYLEPNCDADWRNVRKRFKTNSFRLVDSQISPHSPNAER